MFLIDKWQAIRFRIHYLFTSYPKRLKRFVLCFTYWMDPDYRHLVKDIPDWVAMCVFNLLDLFGIPELLEVLHELSKWNLRSLENHEDDILRAFFGDLVKLHGVRIDERAWLGPKQARFTYVSFHTVNTYGSISPSLMVHELVHVWQYQHFGSFYIYKALVAQHSKEGYYYGGMSALLEAAKKERHFLEFNFEQQASIIQDLYIYSQGADVHLKTVYEYCKAQMLKLTY